MHPGILLNVLKADEMEIVDLDIGERPWISARGLSREIKVFDTERQVGKHTGHSRTIWRSIADFTVGGLNCLHSSSPGSGSWQRHVKATVDSHGVMNDCTGATWDVDCK